MVLINTIDVDPPILNSSCAWSSDLKQLTDLYESPYTGAVTTRTATLHGFKEDDSHSVAFHTQQLVTVNSYGYSPHPLSIYLVWITEILTTHRSSIKPFIISITASNPQTLSIMVDEIQHLRKALRDSEYTKSTIAIELNTSCPNIPNNPPSGYSFKSLSQLLQVLAAAHRQDPTLTIGLKLPPYTYKNQFEEVIRSLQLFSAPFEDNKCNTPFAFLTCTNTLENSLLFADQTGEDTKTIFAVPTVLGGLAGEALHPLALGNVYSFKQMLSSVESRNSGLAEVKIIGVGGVTSKAAVDRMKNAGASVVGCATFLGKEGIRAFEILAGYLDPSK